MNFNLKFISYSGCERRQRTYWWERLQGWTSKSHKLTPHDNFYVALHFIGFIYALKKIFTALPRHLFCLSCVIHISYLLPYFNLFSGRPWLWLFPKRSKGRKRTGRSRSKFLSAIYTSTLCLWAFYSDSPCMKNALQFFSPSTRVSSLNFA